MRVAPAAGTAPGVEVMSSNGLDLMTGEQEVFATDVEAMGGGQVKLVVTDRRIITRSQAGVCSFPWNLCCICLRADVDESLAIADLKYMRPYTFKGCIASCLECMFKASKFPCCCCLPAMRSGGITLSFAKPAGEYVPGWSFWPLWTTGTGNSYTSIMMQMSREQAEGLRKALSMAGGLAEDAADQRPEEQRLGGDVGNYGVRARNMPGDFGAVGNKHKMGLGSIVGGVDAAGGVGGGDLVAQMTNNPDRPEQERPDVVKE